MRANRCRCVASTLQQPLSSRAQLRYRACILCLISLLFLHTFSCLSTFRFRHVSIPTRWTVKYEIHSQTRLDNPLHWIRLTVQQEQICNKLEVNKQPSRANKHLDYGRQVNWTCKKHTIYLATPILRCWANSWVSDSKCKHFLSFIFRIGHLFLMFLFSVFLPIVELIGQLIYFFWWENWIANQCRQSPYQFYQFYQFPIICINSIDRLIDWIEYQPSFLGLTCKIVRFDLCSRMAKCPNFVWYLFVQKAPSIVHPK